MNRARPHALVGPPPHRSLKNDALFAVAVALLALTRPLSRAQLRGVGRALGAAAWALGPLRTVARENVLRAALPMDERARLAAARAAFACMGELLGDAVATVHGRGGGYQVRVRDEDRTRLLSASASGRGVVLASAHLGPWESVARALSEAGIPLTAVTKAPYDLRFGGLFEALRRGAGARFIERDAKGAAMAMMRVLRRGEVLGIPMDLRTRVASVASELLGRPASTAVGPARLALATGAHVLVATIEPPAYVRRAASLLDEPLEVTATLIATADLERNAEGARELTRRIDAELSRRIALAPHGWPWMHPRWSNVTMD